MHIWPAAEHPLVERTGAGDCSWKLWLVEVCFESSISRQFFVFLLSKGRSRLAFEQQRFYNPHHHPEMPRTLQTLDRRAGYSEDYTRYTKIGVCLFFGTSGPGSIGDRYEKEALLRSVE
jgi:hypothetical protein